MATLWHLAEVADWERARAVGAYTGSTLGASLADVGFVHCSSQEQLPRVVAFVYADVSGDYVILEMGRGRVEAAGLAVRDEPADPADPDSELFPHVYGAIPVSVVARVLPARVEQGVLTVTQPG